MAIPEKTDSFNSLLVFIILHLFIYPASNGYNSYFDKDVESIGGLKNPPKVTKELYWTSLTFDLIGLVLSLGVSLVFTLMVFVYGLASKAYSHPATRLKKHPCTGWIVAGVFQGYFTFIASVLGITNGDISVILSQEIQLPAILSSFLLLGSYPMTQIYQHKEDAKRGDFTISRKLGVLGTFHLTALMFVTTSAGLGSYFYHYRSLTVVVLFFLLFGPVAGYFIHWYFRTRQDRSRADFTSTMRLNFISSLMLNVFFVVVWVFF